MCTIVTGLTPFKGHHRMIHRRVGEGRTWVLMAAVTIDFHARVNNRNMGAIWIIGYIRHTGIACRMAAGSLTAARHAGVVEGRGIGKRCRGMARTAVRTCHNMVCRFAGGAEDGATMTVSTRLPGHFGAAVIEGASGKRYRCWGISDVAGRTVARGRYMALRLSCRIHAIVAGRAGIGQCAIYAACNQCRVVEGRGKTAPGFVAILTHS